MNPRALIAEDEPLLAQALQQALTQAWPELRIAATVGDGLSAASKALELRPDLLFFDIRMPGQTGLEAAAELADTWPENQALPALVFVTAYDQYAIAAFEAQAVDYVLKPVQPARLRQTVQRLQAWWEQRRQQDAATALEKSLAQLPQLRQLQALLQPANAVPLQFIQAGVGSNIHMIRVQDIVYLEAADKYVRVLTAAQEYLIRTPLKELLPQLDGARFWQVHRSLVVRADAIASARRDETGKLWLTLRERSEKLPVSRLHAARFKPM